MKTNFQNVEEYIGSFSDEIQTVLLKLREIIIKNAPNAQETISYGIPAYKLNKKPLVYFAAYKTHIGFYATPTGHEAFKEQLAEYKQGKGSVQFPINKKIPFELIKDIVKFRVEENLAKK
jgi:uncharacterized protein YdhG (YjbR/CyaY superfamily)